MEIYTLPANEELKSCIRKITIFLSGEYSHFRQKLTPTPYCCLTYNHCHIPGFETGGILARQKQQLMITGPKTRDYIFALHNGKLCQVLVEFTAAGFWFLFRRSPACLLNKTDSLDHWIESENLTKLSDDLNSVDNPAEHAGMLQRYIASMNALKAHKYKYLETAIKLIEDTNGQITVNTLCNPIHISERQLNRKFIEITGLKPLQFIKLKQLHHIINLLNTERFRSLKELAYETGFYDPAHFNNHFKKLTGMSPGSFLASDEHVAFKYYNDSVSGGVISE